MDPRNPYASPETVAAPVDSAPFYVLAQRANARIINRYFAATADEFLAIVLALFAAVAMPPEAVALQAAALVGVWFGYFLLFELLVSSSVGKLLAGLVVVQLTGDRITWRQAMVRTLFRLLEVNPVFLGGLPAAVCVILSSKRQRFGDIVAGTIVVHKSNLKMRTETGQP